MNLHHMLPFFDTFEYVAFVPDHNCQILNPNKGNIILLG